MIGICIFTIMKIATFHIENETSFYYEPFEWLDLFRLFDGDTICTVDSFVGYKGDQCLSYNKHRCSAEFESMKNPMLLDQLNILPEGLHFSPYEYHLILDGLSIINFVGNGHLFIGDPDKIKDLIHKLSVEESLQLESQQKLILINEQGDIAIEKELKNIGELIDYLTEQLQLSVDPEYLTRERPF